MTISTCPSCGSPEIRKVRKDYSRSRAGQTYVVHDLHFWDCPACGERVFDREAMRRIEECSPAFAGRFDERLSA